VLQGEHSERVLQLTAELIESNSADYTAWQYRWETLMKLQADLTLEYQFTQYVAIPCNHHMPLFKGQHTHAAAEATAYFPTALLIIALSSSGITVITGWGNVFCCVSRRIAEESAKNYQLWNHRRKLANALGPSTAQLELQFCAGRRGASGEGEHRL